ncbi:MAG: HAD family phosphatase [Bacteroidales bacterium]
MAIKNIIFDLGGVIYDICYQNIPEAFQRYGVKNFEILYSKAAQTDVFNLYEEGLVSTEQFREYLHSLSPIPLSDQQIDIAWNSIMIDIPENRIKLLESIKNRYQLFLFSNTNQLNYEYYTQYVKEKFGYDIFNTLFVKAYFSHILQLRKPKPEAFQAIIDEQRLNPSETLFLDDSLQHIEGAKKCGLQTYHVQDGEEIGDILQS